MNVTRDVIVDLLPVYVGGEASADTRALVEEFLKHDAELARRVRGEWSGQISADSQPDLPPDLELKALGRTRRTLVRLRWLLAFAILFTSVAFSLSIERGRATGSTVRLFLFEQSPAVWVACVLLAAGCWTGYFVTRQRLKTVL